jgi:uncharacterized protein (DUF1919 family)
MVGIFLNETQWLRYLNKGDFKVTDNCYINNIAVCYRCTVRPAASLATIPASTWPENSAQG